MASREHQADTQAESTAVRRGEQTERDSDSPSPSARTTSDIGRAERQTVEEILQSLSSGGLLRESELLAAREHSSGQAGEYAVEKLAAWLVERGQITQYQATMLCSGQVSGLVLGNYIVLDKLGQGGMAAVFKARHKRMNRLVALKVLPTALAEMPNALARFQREMEAAARIQHENVAVAYDADEAGGVHFLVSEYIEGPTLASYVKEKGSLSAAAAVGLIVQTARGLAAAHEKGIVHRDIKPGNLMVNRQGVLKVLDLGLAQMRGDTMDTEMTQSGRVLGTVDFMAPEQARDAKAVDPRADIYSLGCTLFFLLSGQPPAPPGGAATKLLWHQTQEPPPLETVCPTATPRLEAAFRRMVAKSPDERFATMLELASELEQCWRELPAHAETLDLDSFVQPVNDQLSTAYGQVVGGAKEILSRQSHPSAISSRAATGDAPTSRWLWVAGGIAAVALLALTAAGAKWGLFGNKSGPSGIPKQVAKSPASPVDSQPVVPSADRTNRNPASTPVGPAVESPKPGLGKAPPSVVSPTVPLAAPLVPMETADWQAARWAIEKGGTVHVVAVGSATPIAASELAQLPPPPFRVQSISLDHAPLVTDDDLPRLGQLAGLESLNLAGTRITDLGLPALAGCRSLRELKLSDSRITGSGLAQLAGWPHLERLELFDSLLSDEAIPQLAKLTSLRELNVEDTRLTDAGLEELAAALPACRVTGDPLDPQRLAARWLLQQRAGVTLAAGPLARAADLPRERCRVVAVDLSDLPKLSPAEVARQLAACEEIADLRLRNVVMSDEQLAFLAKLPNLRQLELTNVPIDDAGLAGLASHEQLESIDLSGTRVTGRCLAYLAKSTHLKQLLLANARLEPAQLAALAEFKELETLDLSASREVGDANLGFLDMLTQLRVLGLRSTAITNASAERIAGLSRLEQLDLEATAIDDGGLAQLAPLQKLKRLVLTKTAITDGALGTLAQFKQLKSLGLSRTKVTAEAARQLHLALPGCSIMAPPPVNPDPTRPGFNPGPLNSAP
jgi:serine/threonine protein kinase/Leucine-rich repeat (LRR) protein